MGILVALAAGTSLPLAAAPMPSTTKAFLQKHCFECHDADTQKGKLRLDALVPDFAAPATAEQWAKVFFQLAHREMPPAKKPQPTDKDRQTVLDWLGRELRTAQSARHSAEGRVALRRFNRVEYQNTIRDLFGVQVNVLELLPEDGQSHGFDKVDAALTLSPVRVEKYLEAADLALDTALGVGPQPKFLKEHYVATNTVASWDSKSVRCLDDNDSVVLFNSGYSPTELRKFPAPAPGAYRVRVSASGFQTSGQPQAFRLYAGNFQVGGKTKLIGHFDVPADKLAVVELTPQIEGRGDTLKIFPYGSIPWQNTGATYTGLGLAVQWIKLVVNTKDARVAIGPTVDAADTLADGRAFHDLAELKKLLLANPETIARGLAEKLLIHEIVASTRFQTKSIM